MHLKKKWFTAPIKGYQYISRMLPGSCRYYPTCSAYALWLFETASPQRALASGTLRILRCNQLFPGGIDYPRIPYKTPSILELANPVTSTRHTKAPLPKIQPLHSPEGIKYWFIPTLKEGEYYVVKDFNAS